uniref:peptidylprolyl isomerase n=1 Tax=Globodera pallida TaxID=36090 RepID=A0A183CNM2_GLOPA
MEEDPDAETKPVDVTKAMDGGVLKTLLKAGENFGVHPAKGDCCYVHYEGIIKESGKVFDSSRGREMPFFFTFGRGQVIKGWDLGVATMCRGEIARLECRPEYAYGETGHPPKIPGNSTLIFEIELLRWEGEDLSPDRDGTITKSIVVSGKKFKTPTEHAGIKVHAVGTSLDGRIFYDAQLEYVLGEGAEHALPDGSGHGFEAHESG